MVLLVSTTHQLCTVTDANVAVGRLTGRPVGTVPGRCTTGDPPEEPPCIRACSNAGPTERGRHGSPVCKPGVPKSAGICISTGGSQHVRRNAKDSPHRRTRRVPPRLPGGASGRASGRSRRADRGRRNETDQRDQSRETDHAESRCVEWPGVDRIREHVLACGNRSVPTQRVGAIRATPVGPPAPGQRRQVR